MNRKQFTFYESFYKAMRKIKNKAARADVFDAICAYALYEEEPDEDRLHPMALAIFEMAKPVLDTAQKRMNAAMIKHEKQMQNGCKPSAHAMHIACEGEKEIEIENEIELERESERARERFEIFWKNYPKKIDKKTARSVFRNVDAPLQVLLDALQVQKNSSQWLEENGRFIPRAAAWLRDRRWEDEVTVEKVPMGASGQLGPAELDAIRQMLQE